MTEELETQFEVVKRITVFVGKTRPEAQKFLDEAKQKLVEPFEIEEVQI